MRSSSRLVSEFGVKPPEIWFYTNEQNFLTASGFSHITVKKKKTPPQCSPLPVLSERESKDSLTDVWAQWNALGCLARCNFDPNSHILSRCTSVFMFASLPLQGPGVSVRGSLTFKNTLSSTIQFPAISPAPWKYSHTAAPQRSLVVSRRKKKQKRDQKQSQLASS